MLKQCDFTLDLPGFKENFSTREELDQFIDNNYERIRASMDGALVQFSKNYNNQEEVIAILSKAKADTPTEVVFDAQGNKVEGLNIKEGYTGVTKDMDKLTMNGKALFQPFNKENFKASSIPRIFDRLKNNNPEKLTDDQLLDQATDEVNAQIKSWDFIKNIGVDIHTLASVYFENPDISREELYYKVKRLMNKENLTFTKAVSDKIHDGFSRYTRDLAIGLGQPAKDIRYFSEVAIYDEESKLVGILDLVAVDAKGTAYLIDFKISNKNIEQWDKDKTDKAVLQLAYYKQLLNKQGIRVARQGLIPISINNLDIEASFINDIVFEPNIVEDYTASLIAGKHVNLSKIAKNRLPTSEGALIATKRTGEVQKQYDQFFTIKDATDESKVERFILTRVHKGKEGDYFRTNDRENVVLSPNPDLRKKQILQQILMESLSSNDLVETVKSQILATKNSLLAGSKKSTEYRNPLGGYARTSNHQKIFKKYMMSPSWEVMNLEELESHGIIGFRNIEFGQMEFVILTTEELTYTEKLAKGKSLIGNYVSDAEQLTYAESIPPANTKYKQAVKIISHINENMELFKDSTLHLIRAYNTMTEDLESVDNTNLLRAYEYLALANKIPYNVKTLKSSPAELLLQSELYSIFETDTVQNEGVKRWFESISQELGKMTNDNTVLVHSLVELKKRFIKENPKYRDESKINYEDDPLTNIYGYLNKLISEKSNLNIRSEDRDMKEYAISNSLYFSSFNEIQQATLRAALEPIRMSKDAMAQEYTQYNDSKLRPIFEKFYKAKNASVGLGDHIMKFSNLFVTDPTGKVSKNFVFKNPELHIGDSSYLDSAERTLLNEILPIMHQFMYNGQNVEEAKAEGWYYEVPILRAGTSSMIFGQTTLGGMVAGAGNAIMNAWREGMDIYNYFEEEMAEVSKSADEMREVYDRFNISRNPNLRAEAINKYNHLDFEKNIEIVISTLVFDTMRKKAFDRALPITAAVMSASKLYQEGLTSKDVSVLYDYIKKYVKTVVFNDKLTEKHNEGMFRTLAGMKHFVTMMQLGLAPMTMVREVFQGQINNLIKNWTRQYGEAGPSLEDYSRAVHLIGAQEVFGMGENKSFFTDVTRTEAINHLYRFANLDTTDLPNKMVISKTGATQMTSRWLLWFTASPDYLNRMTVLIAKMIKDGSLDAHQMVDGELKYYWKKDKRFEKYANDIKTDMVVYNYQKQLYLKHIEEFNKEEAVTGVYGKMFKPGDDLPRGYTGVERESLKSFINYTLGPYDKEEKPLFNSTMFGMMFMQFKTWMVSKKTQYWLETGNYSMGYWKHEEDLEGNKLYLDEGNNRTTEVTDNPYLVWKGKLQEGVFNSIIRTIKDFDENGYNFKSMVERVSKDDLVKANVSMAVTDLSLWFIIGIVFKGMIDWEELEKDTKLGAAFANAFANSTSDLLVWNTVKSFINPPSMLPTAGYFMDNFSILGDAITGQRDVGRILLNSAAVTRNLDDLTNIFER